MTFSVFQHKHFISKLSLCLFLFLAVCVLGPFDTIALAMAKRPPRPSLEIQSPSKTIIIPDEKIVASPALGLSDLVSEALKQNPELHAYRERWVAAKGRVWQALSWDDTMIGADF